MDYFVNLNVIIYFLIAHIEIIKIFFEFILRLKTSIAGDMFTAQPEEVADKMKELLFDYNSRKEKTFDDLLDFHYKFDCIRFKNIARLVVREPTALYMI